MGHRNQKPCRDLRRAFIAECREQRIAQRVGEQDEAGAIACPADREPTARETRLEAHAARIRKALDAQEAVPDATPRVGKGSGGLDVKRRAKTRQNATGDLKR